MKHRILMSSVLTLVLKDHLSDRTFLMRITLSTMVRLVFGTNFFSSQRLQSRLIVICNALTRI